MKQLHSIEILFILLLTTCFMSCSDDDDKTIGNGITGQSWTEGKPLEISTGKTLSVTFNAKDKWTASTASTWCSLLTSSGNSGESTLQLLASSTTSAARTAIITITVNGYSPISLSVTQNPESTSVGDLKINTQVDAYLKDIYLWNDEYKTLTLDFTKNYEDFFYDALGSMTTNTLDKKPTGNGTKYTLFSYIEKREIISGTRSTKLVDKELQYNFGITGIGIVQIINQGYYFLIQGVYPDSPAAQAGIKRGTVINKINGGKITDTNLADYYYDLIYPTQILSMEVTDDKGTTMPLTSKAMYTNPVIKKQVDEINGYKIGYLVYSGFDASFDDEVFEAFKYFKNQGVTDLILDLRYNGGGHTISANLIASCIAGAASQGKVFAQYRYNDERMKKYNNQRPVEMFSYSNYANLDTPLTNGGLGLTRLYCLVSGNTASASELVINSLEGIDVPVILIGETTVGKNVGMEYKDITIDEDTYRVVPISFQTYNAKGFGDYSTGFTPDLLIDENNPYNKQDDFYNYRDYGTPGEFLYAAAVEMITGVDISPETRSSTDNVLKGKMHTLPGIFRPGYSGMLKNHEE